jgi:hypothetical protein
MLEDNQYTCNGWKKDAQRKVEDGLREDEKKPFLPWLFIFAIKIILARMGLFIHKVYFVGKMNTVWFDKCLDFI